jgi:hypothetical protein
MPRFNTKLMLIPHRRPFGDPEASEPMRPAVRVIKI